MIGIRNFQDTFETRKRLFMSAFSIFMTVPLSDKVMTCTLIQFQPQKMLWEPINRFPK